MRCAPARRWRPTCAARCRVVPLQTYAPQRRTLYLLSCGERRAIASWGGWTAEGAWVWRWKDRIDRAFVARYTRVP